MDDEVLRATFAALVQPVQQIPVPDSSGLRRRVRHRRAGQATASALACACIAAAGGFLFRPSHSPAPPIGYGVGCDIVARWLPPAHVDGLWAEGPPQTSLLVLRNVGTATCSLYGWPRLVFPGLSGPHRVTVEYKTKFDVWIGKARTRVVEPTKIRLAPGAAAVSAVTIELPPALQAGTCFTRAWLVRPPGPGDAIRSRGDLPEICSYTWIMASPLYPPSVPTTQNYPSSTSSPIPPRPVITATIRATRKS